MITVTKQERDNMVASAEATLMAKCKEALFELRRGLQIHKVAKSLATANSLLESAENYRTGEYQPEEYFNILSPDNFSGIFSNINTINK